MARVSVPVTLLCVLVVLLHTADARLCDLTEPVTNDGVLPAETVVGTVKSPSGMAAGDFDGDTHDEYVIGDEGTKAVLYWQPHPIFDGLPGTRAVDVVRPAVEGYAPGVLAVGDLDQDGLDDIITANGPGIGDFAWVPNVGRTQPFYKQTQELMEYDPISQGPSLFSADVNGDGYLDFFGVETTTYSADVYYRLNLDNAGAWGPWQRGFARQNSIRSFLLADVSGDGFPDIILGRVDGRVLYQVNAHPATPPFTSAAGITLATADTEIYGLAVINGTAHADCACDIVAAAKTGVWLFPVATPGAFDAGIQIHTATDVRTVVPLGAPNDTQHIVFTATGSDEVVLLVNSGDGTAWTPDVLTSSPAPWPLVIADFDDDGFPDIAFADTSTDEIYLMWGTAPVAWGPPTLATTRALDVITLQLVDWDGDGRTDLLVAAQGSDDVLVLPNAGNRAWNMTIPVVKVPAACGGKAVAVLPAPYDNRTEATIIAVPSALATIDVRYPMTPFSVETNRSLWFPGFGEPIEGPASAYSPYELHVADADANGWPDLVIAASQVVVLHPSLGGPPGSVSWGPAVLIDGGVQQCFHITVADLTGDGLLDIVAAGQTGRALINPGVLVAANWTSIQLTAGAAEDVAVADLDTDTHPDIAILLASPYTVFWVRNTLSEGGNMTVGAQERHTIVEPDAISSGDVVNTIRFGDVNADGNPNDLITTGRYLVFLINQGTSGLDWAPIHEAKNYGSLDNYPVFLADWKPPGTRQTGNRPALVTYLLTSPPQLVYLEQITVLGDFEPYENVLTLSDTGVPAIHYVDVDGDSYVDAVVRDPEAGEVRWIQNKGGDGTSTDLETLINIPGMVAIDLGDVNGDGLLDVAVAADDPLLIAWVVGLGAGSFEQTPVTITTDTLLTSPQSLAVVDLDQDGDQDILVGTATRIVLFAQTVASSDPAAVAWYMVDLGVATSTATQLRLADLTNDGVDDVIVLNRATSWVRWLHNLWPAGTPITNNTNPTAIVAGYQIPGTSVSMDNVYALDLDGNGRLDIVYGRSGGTGLYWCNNTGPLGGEASRFGSPVRFWLDKFPDYDAHGYALAIADLLNDGSYVMIGSPYLYSGYRVTPTTKPVGQLPEFTDTYGAAILGNNRGRRDTSAGFVDWDGDGALDLWMSSVRSDSYKAWNTWRSQTFWMDKPLPAKTHTIDATVCGFHLSCVAAAITRASLCSGDTVVLPGGTYDQCFHRIRYRIQKDVMITAAPGETVVFDCGSRSGVGGERLGWHVDGGAHVTIRGVTFKNFRTSKTDFGGAALVVSGDETAVTLEDVTFANCTAPRSAQTSIKTPLLGFGGAVLVEAGTMLEVKHTVFRDNSAGHSGGSLAVVGDRVRVTLSHTQFIGNHAEISGGAVFYEASPVLVSTWDPSPSFTVANTTFVDNVVVGISGGTDDDSPSGESDEDESGVPVGGGALALAVFTSTNVSLDTVSVTGSTVAGDGGALLVSIAGDAAVDARAQLSLVTAVTVTDNACTGSGGAIAVVVRGAPFGAVAVSVGDTTLARNHASLDGGVVAVTSPPLAPGLDTYAGVTVAMGDGTSANDNTASRDGGLLSVKVDPAHRVSVGLGTGSSLVVRRSHATRFGGVVVVAGGGGVDAVLGPLLSARDNTARWGALAASLGAPQYAQTMPTTGGPSLLPREPVRRTVGTGTCHGDLATVTVDGADVRGLRADYGTAAFACQGRVSLQSASRWSDNRATVAGGLAFACRPRPCSDAQATSDVASCCPASQPQLLGVPWVDASPGFWSAFEGQSEAPLVGTVGTYGAVSASPATNITVSQPLPLTSSSGVALARGEVTLTDHFGQAVHDPYVELLMTIRPFPEASLMRLTGGASLIDATASPVAFGGVAVASLDADLLRSNGGRGVEVPLAITVVESTQPTLVVTGSVSVGVCRPGFGVATTGSSSLVRCSTCASGTFSNATGLEPCKACPPDSFFTGDGAYRCLQCPAGSGVRLDEEDETVLLININCTCLPGFWDPAGRGIDVECLGCPRGAQCLGGGSQPTALPGFFPLEDNPSLFLECPTEEACSGGHPFTCRTGHEGYLCAGCRRDYYQLNGLCYKCNMFKTVTIMVLLCLAVFVAVAGLVYLNTRSDLSYRYAALMIGLNSLQISAMYGQLDLQWNTFTRMWIDIISFFNFDLRLVGPECQAGSMDPYILRWLITMALPLLFVIPFAIIYGLALLYTGYFVPKFDLDSLLTMRLVTDGVRRACFQMTTLLYMPLIAASMSYFQCRREENGEWVLEPAPNRPCYTADYWKLWPLAFVMSLLYGAGIPLLVFGLLWRARRNAERDEDDSVWLFELRYSFLVARFQRPYYYFEVCVMLRKLGVVMAMTLLLAHPNKGYGSVLVLIASLLQLMRWMPYLSAFHNWLAVICVASCMAVVWAATFAGDKTRDAGLISAVVVNVLAILIGNAVDCYYLWVSEREVEHVLEDDDFFVKATEEGMPMHATEITADAPPKTATIAPAPAPAPVPCPAKPMQPELGPPVPSTPLAANDKPLTLDSVDSCEMFTATPMNHSLQSFLFEDDAAGIDACMIDDVDFI